MDTYRFRWKGCALQDIIQQVPPGVVVTLANAMAKAWVDVTLDPGAPGSPAQVDLNGIMLDMGWIPFSVNPTTPLQAVTVKQSLQAVLAVDSVLAVVAPFAPLLSQAITTDAGFLDVEADISAFSLGTATYFRLVVDGVVMAGGGSAVGIGEGSTSLRRRVAVAAGAHAVELQWRIAAIGSASVRPVAQPDSESATLTISEYVT